MKHRLTRRPDQRTSGHWIILASGPNRAGWYEHAEREGCHVFCMNGSVALCENPSAYVATDRIAIEAFEPYWTALALDCPRFIGRTDVEHAVSGGYAISGHPVRTAALWATYLALQRYAAMRVHLYGVYGAENGEWHTVSSVAGRFNGRAKYAALARKAGKAEPQEAVLLHQGLPDESNENAAMLIVAMRKQFPSATIELHGDGPVAKILKRLEDGDGVSAPA